MQLTEAGGQHPKPLVWDFVLPATNTAHSLRLWSPVMVRLYSYCVQRRAEAMFRSAVVIKVLVEVEKCM